MTMIQWSKCQQIMLAVAPLPSSLLSLITSTVMIITILRSRSKLNKPYRRIIFGMSIYSIIQAIAFSTASLAFDAHQYQLQLDDSDSNSYSSNGYNGSNGHEYSTNNSTNPWAGAAMGIGIGNQATCEAQGFVMQLSLTGTPLYTLSLAIFYLCVIKYEMPDETFRKKVEPYLHLITNLWAWSTASFALLSGSIHSSTDDSSCYINASPLDCLDDPDVDCVHGQNSLTYRWIFVAIPLLLCIIACVAIMVNICKTVISQQKQMDEYRTRWQTGSQSNNHTNGNGNGNNDTTGSTFSRRLSSRIATFIRPSSELTDSVPTVPTTIDNRNHNHNHNNNNNNTNTNTNENISTSILAYNRNRLRRSNRASKEVVRQATYFVCIYILINILPIMHCIITTIYGSVPYAFIIFYKLVYPIQGFLNIIIYTRPHVGAILRRKNNNFSWLYAFISVMKLGGDNDTLLRRRSVNVRRRSSTIQRDIRPMRARAPIRPKQTQKQQSIVKVKPSTQTNRLLLLPPTHKPQLVDSSNSSESDLTPSHCNRNDDHGNHHSTTNHIHSTADNHHISMSIIEIDNGMDSNGSDCDIDIDIDIGIGNIIDDGHNIDNDDEEILSSNSNHIIETGEEAV